MDIHRRAFVADLHCDTLLFIKTGLDVSIRNETGHVDLPRLKQGGVNLQVFACFLPVQIPADEAVAWVDELLGLLVVTTARNEQEVAICTTTAEARRTVAEGRIAAVLSIENGQAIAGNLHNLEYFYRRGVRSMTLVHAVSHDWCISSADPEPAFDGLTDFGRDVVREMNGLGMIVDISHLSLEAVRQVLEVSKAPIIASHSCVHALCPHHRNLSDDQIQAVADTGGMIGVNFCGAFLLPEFFLVSTAFTEAHEEEYEAVLELMSGMHKDDAYRLRFKKLSPFLDAWSTKMLSVPTAVTMVADHIDYIVNLVGPEYVGLGSDFDGIIHPPIDLADCSMMPNITRELVRRGYAEADIRKILGENFMRVFAQVCDR